MSKKSERTKDGTPILIDYSLYRDREQDIREGSQAASELTSVIAQIIYREIDRRKEFRNLLILVEQTLSTSIRRVHGRTIKLKEENSKLSKDALDLESDLERIREVVISTNLEQMRTLLEDIYNWKGRIQSRSEEWEDLPQLEKVEEK